MSRPLLQAARVSPEAATQISEFQRRVIEEVTAAVEHDDVVVIGMAQNPHVRNVREALRAAGIAFTYIEYGSYFSAWRERLAVKLWSGWPTFPQVFLKGRLIGGEELTRAALAAGTIQANVGSIAPPGPEHALP